MTEKEQRFPYEDILEMPRPVSSKRSKMSNADRAAQFAPFAALTGYEAVIRETGRVTESRIELDEGAKAMLNEKLQIIAESVPVRPLVTFICFRRDQRKAGGAYVRISGRVKKIDAAEEEIHLTDGTVIGFSSLYGIEGELFRE